MPPMTINRFHRLSLTTVNPDITSYIAFYQKLKFLNGE